MSAAAERPVTLDKSLDDIIKDRDQGKKKEKPAKRDNAPADKKAGAGGAVKPKGQAGRANREGDRVIQRKPKRADGESAGPRARVSSFTDDREPEVWRHDKFSKAGAASKPFPKPRSESPAPTAARPPITLGTRILITNLDPEINAEDIREIFGKVGELRTVAIHYDAHNKPKGVAEVVYRHRAAADAAVKEFDGRQVDETRIRVKIIDDGAAAAGEASGAPTEARRGRGFAEGGSARDVAFKVTASAPPPTRDESKPRGQAPARGGHGGPQRGGRGGAARPAPRKVEKKEEVDLDAELAAYASKR